MPDVSPFFTSCTTCKVKLKVRSKAAIGQILACPKCQSMVMIVPPTADDLEPQPAAKTQPSTDIAADIVSKSDSAFEYVEDALSNDPPEASPPTPWLGASNTPESDEPVADDGVDVSDTAADDEESPPTIESTEQSTASSTEGVNDGEEDQDHDAASPLLPGSDWISNQTHRKRKLLAGGVGALALLVTIGLLVQLVLQHRRNPRQPEIVATPNDGDEQHRVDEQQDVAKSAEDGGGVQSADSYEPVNAADVNAADSEAVDTNPPPHGNDEPSPAIGLAVDGPEPVSPLVGDEELHVTPTSDAEGDQIADAEPQIVKPQPVEPELVEPQPVVVLKPALPPIDVDKLLSEPIGDIQLEEIALVDFARFMTELTTVPITIDPASLGYVRANADVKISVSATDSTAADLLRLGLKEANLHLVVEADHAVVTRLSKNESPYRDFKHQLDDLAASGPLDIVAGWIEQMVAPTSWKSRGGEGSLNLRGTSLKVYQQTTVHYQILEFTEKLRVARGRSTRYPGYDADQFSLETRSSKARSALQSTVRLGSIRPKSFVQTVASLEQQAKVRLLVDWGQLSKVGIAPDSTERIPMRSAPLTDALESWLKPLGLTALALDAKTFQITTITRAAGKLDVEFYRIRDLLVSDTLEDLVRQIRNDVGEDNFGPGIHGALAFDETSGCLIVSLPQSRQRQVETFLKQFAG